jgi:hypothetical protein
MEQAEVKLKEELGEEGYRKHLADKKEKQDKANKAERRDAAYKRTLDISAINTKLTELQQFHYDLSISIDGIMIAKTAAKKDWYISEYELEKLEGVQKGKSTKYKVVDVIRRQFREYEL